LQALVERFGTPLAPDPDVDQGDPFLLEVPPGTRGPARYLVFVSGAGFPLYGSDDLVRWRPLGPSLEADGEAWTWAPAVTHVPGLARPWVMHYSRALGAGEVDGHREHRIRRADSTGPAGPYRDSGDVLTADLDFAIDPDLRRRPDGTAVLTFATDYVDAPPYGTGLAEATLDPELRRITGPVRPVARARADWQVYDPARSMPWKTIPGVRWDAGDTVRWHTMEGPASLVSPAGVPTLLYSGGNFAGFYGVGVLRREAGTWVDASPTPADCLLAPDPARGVHGPGHCSVLDTDGGQLLCFHFRTAPDRPRQFGIVPLRWGADDRPYCLVGSTDG
jgi:arabinan endo-1,5-alpha-L-arabinosidase